MKILVVEDDATSRRSLVRLLAEEGHDACGVESAREAVEACRRRCPDPLILDEHLPDASGLDALDAVRASCLRALPALLVGQTLGSRTRRRAVRGGVPVLRKPLSPAALLSGIRHAGRGRALA